MPLNDPVAVFTASTNLRAQMLCHGLTQAGIEAYVQEDESLVGLWMGGTIPGIHSPKIWVDRADAPRAAALIQEMEQREAELRQPSAGDADDIEVVCQECEQIARFSIAQQGSVQECPHCGAYLDVEKELGD